MTPHLVRRVRAFSLACLTLGCVQSTYAQQAPPPATMPTTCSAPCVAIRSTGGFLGYLDGFPEFPGWAGDTFEGNPDIIAESTRNRTRPIPYGGVVGVATFLRSHAIANRAAEDSTVLLLSGNNHPQQIAAMPNSARQVDAHGIPAAATHWFWQRIKALDAAAIGVGSEDIQRWLTQMRPEQLTRWLAEGIGAGLPFVASNVIIRLADDDLNVIHHPELNLTVDLPATTSLDMISSLTLRHSCAIAQRVRSATYTFDHGPGVTIVASVTTGTGRESSADRTRRSVLGDNCRTEAKLTRPLALGQTYLLRSSLTGPTFRFRLTTHGTLTPHVASAGLPVVRVTRAGVPMAVMGFVSPATARSLPAEYFEWTRAQGCDAAHCRIDFVPAEKAARWLMESVAAPTSPAPVLLAISDLREADTSTLLDTIPDIRFIALRPDSGRLGRAGLAVDPDSTDSGRYSGDRSFGAVVDERYPELTRVMVRPTWLGEIVHTVFADFVPPSAGHSWQLARPSLWVHPVPGASLNWDTSVDGTIRYSTFLNPARFVASGAPVDADPAAFPAYCPIDPAAPFDAITREPQADLWTNAASFAGLVLDEMRRTTSADIAIMPNAWIDRDVLAAIKDPPARGAPPPSGFVLQRLLYRATRIVHVAVEGSQLADTLNRIVSGAADTGDPVCVSGLGLSDRCPVERIDDDDLLVNLRRPEAGLYYRVALPATLAYDAGLMFDERVMRDVRASLDTRLAACRPEAEPHTASAVEGSLATRLENRRAQRWRHYLTLDPLTLDFASTSVRVPDGEFATLPADGSGERPSRRITLDGDLNAVVVDTAGFALRFPAQLRYSQTRIDHRTSYDQDEFSIGVRLDRKRFPTRWSRLFGGVFWDGRLFSRTEDIESAGPTVAFTTAPLRNLAVVTGIEVQEQTFGPTTVRGLQVSFYYGQVYNVPVAAQLGTETIDLAGFLETGASETVSAAHRLRPGSVTETTPFGYVTATRRQTRVQVDAKTSTVLPVSMPMTLATEHRYRIYGHHDTRAGLFTARSADTAVSLDIGITKRWMVGPYLRRTDTSVRIEGGRLHHFRVVSWGVQFKLPLYWNGRVRE